MAAERQRQMNQGFEKILKNPVLITCPRQSSSSHPTGILRDDQQSLNVANAAATKSSQIIALNTSSENSCSSILVGHVEPQRKESAQNEQVLQQLQQLWDEIQEQKNQLFRELNNTNKCHQSTNTNVADRKNTGQQTTNRDIRNEVNRNLKNVEIQTTDHNGAAQLLSIETTKDGSEAPVKIIINVKGDKQPPPPQEAVKPSKERRQISDNIGQKYPKTPAKTKKNRQEVVKITTDPDGSSTSTAYHGLPNRIHTEMSAALSQPRKTIESPALAHYITRLLGMTRSSIEQLGVSSASTVDTASSSIINGSSNVSIAVFEDDEQRLEKLQRFIDDNHNFLSSIDESLKASNNVDNVDKVETVWMQTLQEKEAEMKRDRLKQQQRKAPETNDKKTAEEQAKVSTAQPIRPILKKPVAKDDASLLQTFDDVTDNCNRRIANLTEMIQKVRQEKHRLMESAFSTTTNNNTSKGSSTSSQGKGKNSTEYLDFGEGGGGGGREDLRSTTPEESVATEEMARRLVGSKQIGISRDSGICVSRPITATGLRDSPIEAPFQPTAEMIKEIEERGRVKPPVALKR